MLNAEEFSKLPEGIFRQGLCSDSPTGCNIDATGKILKWIAVKYNRTEWAIYLNFPEKSDEWIFRHGTKTRSEGNIRQLVPCTDEVYSNYSK